MGYSRGLVCGELELMMEMQSDAVQSARGRWRHMASGEWAPFGSRSKTERSDPLTERILREVHQ